MARARASADLRPETRELPSRSRARLTKYTPVNQVLFQRLGPSHGAMMDANYKTRIRTLIDDVVDGESGCVVAPPPQT